MRFTFNLPSNQIVAPKVMIRRGTAFSGIYFNMDGFSFNLDSPASDLVFSSTNSSSTPPVNISYTSETQRMNWGSSVTIGGNPTSDEGGVVNAVFSFTGTARWGRGPNPELYPNQLQLLFSFGSHLGVKVDPQKYSWWEQIFGAKNSLPPSARDIRPAAPVISVDMTPMDYFLTTNLLFPGEHIFHIDDPSQTTEMQGLMTPRDTILTGMIKRN
jgi:hypothetical protein